MTTLIQHQSASSNWYTPIPIIEMARTVLGTIDLDPASDAFGNLRVKASAHFNHDGLIRIWSGAVFLNPPGGKVGRLSQMKLFWEKLIEARIAGLLEHAVFVAFSLEALQSTQSPYADCSSSLCDFPFCIPSQRIRFDGPDGKPGAAPSHANAIAYVPGNIDRRDLFAKTFAPLGACINIYPD